MTAKIVSQKKWAKLVASTGALSQPPGALSRLSNLLFTQRGSLQVADGSTAISVALPSSLIAALGSFANLQPGQFPYYEALAYSSTPQLTDVADFTVSSIVHGTDNPAGSYTFAVAANVGATHTNAKNSAYTLTVGQFGTFNAVNFTWTAVTGATGYTVYLIVREGLWRGYISLGTSTGTSFTYTGVLPTTGAVSPAPTFNNTYELLLYVSTTLVSLPPQVTFGQVTAGVFPFTPPQPATLAPGTAGFNATPSIPSFSPYGGITGLAGPLPQVMQFAGKSILVLGNGYAPQSYDPAQGTSGAVTPLNNTFQDSYPSWEASVSWTTDDQLTAANGKTNYYFTATQGGVSGSSEPSWSFAKGTKTTDGSVIWTSQGPIIASIAPIGAAHAIVYAGSLWLANTWPISTEFNSWAESTDYVTGDQIAVEEYGSWIKSTAYTTDEKIIVVNSGSATSYVFTATTGGTSGTSTPSWHYTVGSTTTDGGVTWTCTTANVASDLQGYWIFTASVGGTSGSAAPTWNFTNGGTTTDGGVTWTAATSTAALTAGIDGPSCLKMSESNNPNSWNPTNVAFIGKNDGTQITGIQPFTIAALGISPTGSLCIFKEFTTYQFIGVFGSTSYEIQPAQTNLGCIASRSIQFLPGFGVVRYSHLGFAMFDGINDRLISEDIRPYLFGGVASEADITPVDPSYLYLSQSAQTITPPTYMCAMPLAGASGVGGVVGSGLLTRLFCYDLVMKSWAVLDLPWAITTLSTIAAGEGYPLVLAGKVDGTIHRIQAGDLNWNQGDDAQTAVQWSFRSPDLFGEGGTQKMFYEQATITGYGSVAMAKSIIAALWLDGQQLGAQAIDIIPQGGSNLFEARVRIFRSGCRAHLDVNGNNGGAAGVIDSIDWAVSPKSAMSRRVIS